MSVIPKSIVGQLGNSAAAILTAGPGQTLRIVAATLLNTGAGGNTVDLYHVPPAGSAAAANQVVSGKSIDADATWIAAALLNKHLMPGESLQGLASSAAEVTYDIAYLLIA